METSWPIAELAFPPNDGRRPLGAPRYSQASRVKTLERGPVLRGCPVDAPMAVDGRRLDLVRRQSRLRLVGAESEV
jgi:hypothetical protein